MSHHIPAATAALFHPFLTSVSQVRALAQGMLDRAARKRRESRDYRHLHDLPDYLIEDVGLTRNNLKSIMDHHLI